ncbi:MAG: hypothetical protein ACR2H9_02420 [Longimicrobiaceae bacterium]
MTSPGAAPPVLGWRRATDRGDRLLIALLSGSFIFFVFFPYAQLLPLQTDTQPYALLISILAVLAVRIRRLPLEILLLLPVLLFSLPLALLGEASLTAVRSLGNYFSVFLIACASYVLLKAAGGFSVAAFKAIVVIWFAVGFIQTFFYADFLVFLTPRAVGTAGLFGRGVVGLSPEPTHYGTYCIFLLILTLLLARVKLLSRRESAILAALLVVQITVFAQSAMTVLLLVLFAGLYVGINFFSLRKLVTSLVVLALLGGGLAAVLSRGWAPLEATRVYSLLTRLFEDPMLVLMIDQSVNDRFFHIFFSFYGFFENFGLPHGYTAWTEHVLRLVHQFSPYAWAVSPARIMSGYGAALFEMGVVALLVPLSLTIALRRFFGSDVRSFLIVAVFLHLVMLTNVPLAFPLFGFLIGLLAYYVRYGPQALRHQRTETEVGSSVPA